MKLASLRAPKPFKPKSFHSGLFLISSPNIEQREMDRLSSNRRSTSGNSPADCARSAVIPGGDRLPIRFGLEIEDAIILALVVADLNSPLGTGQHLFANRNLKDFDDPDVIEELRRLGCDTAHSFAEAVNRLGVR